MRLTREAHNESANQEHGYILGSTHKDYNKSKVSAAVGSRGLLGEKPSY